MSAFPLTTQRRRLAHRTRPAMWAAVVVGMVMTTLPLVAVTGAGAEADHITGRAFYDEDADGRWEPHETIGVAGVDIVAYDSAGNEVASTTTDAAGDYRLPVAPGATVRVEAHPSAASAPYVPGPAGTDDAANDTWGSETTVTFATEGDVHVDIGFVHPEAYCNANPSVFTPCFVFGSRDDSPAEPASVAIPFGYSGTSPPKSMMTPADDVGSVYGTSWRRPADPNGDGDLLVSSFVKRHTDLGPGDGASRTTGGIYRVTPDGTAGAQGELLIDLYAEGIDTGDATAIRPFIGDPAGCPDGPDTADALLNCWLTDDDAFGAVGKTGLGDLDFSPDGDYLFTVNLNNRSLVRIPVTATSPLDVNGTIVEYDTELDSLHSDCPNGDWRPFALGRDLVNDVMYLGATCTGETTFASQPFDPDGDLLAQGFERNLSDTAVDARDELAALVYRFDPDSPAVTLDKVLDAPLNYQRRDVCQKVGLEPFGKSWGDCSYWSAWSDVPADYWETHTEADGTRNSNRDEVRERPIPLLADIQVENDNLVLGLRDLWGDIGGNWGFLPGAGPADEPFETVADGDLLKACAEVPLAATFTLEADGICGGVPGAGASHVNEGPGPDLDADGDIGEFFEDNWFFTENVTGAIALLQSREDGLIVTSNHPQPQDGRTEGLVRFNPDDGSNRRDDPGGAVIFRSAGAPPVDPAGTFSKANGLGALAPMCEAAPLEIGNYLWYDTDGDGVQDPDESPVVGATVSLYEVDGGGNRTLVGTRITDDDGEYYFSSNHEFTGAWVQPDYRLKANTDYVVAVDNAADYTGAGPLAGWSPTIALQGNGIDPTLNDSNGVVPAGGSFPETTVTTGGAGDNDHSLDFGFGQSSSLDITKAVDDADAVFDPATTFTVTVRCLIGVDSIDHRVTLRRDGTVVIDNGAGVTLGDGQTLSVEDIPFGASCELTERPPSGGIGPDHQWMPGVFSGDGIVTPANPVTVDPVRGQHYEIDLDNAYTALDGSFVVRKVVESSGTVVRDGLRPGTTFDVTVTCRTGGGDLLTQIEVDGNAVANGGTFAIGDGSALQIGGVPLNGTCELDEADLDDGDLWPSFAWIGQQFDGGPIATPTDPVTVTVGDVAGLELNLRNTYEQQLGSIDVTKTVDPVGADPAVDFTIAYSCVLDGYPGSPLQGSVDVDHGETVTISELPTGATCTFSEPNRPDPEPATDWLWDGDPEISPNPVPVGDGTTVDVAVINRAIPATGALTIRKQVVGVPGGQRPDATFEVAVVCQDDGGGAVDPTITVDGTAATSPVTIDSDAIITVDDVPLGGSCELTETDIVGTGAGLVDGYEWVSQTFSGDVVTSGNPATVEIGSNTSIVTLTNQFTQLPGGFTVTKQVVPSFLFSPGGGSFTVHYDCTNGSVGDVMIGAGDAGSVTGLAVGTECTLTETNRSDPADGDWFWDPNVPAQFSPASPITITSATTPVEVTLTNTADIQRGTLTLTKAISGPAGGIANGITPSFDVTVSCSSGSQPMPTLTVDGATETNPYVGEITEGTDVVVSNLPFDATCELTEDEPATGDFLEPSYVWQTHTFAGDHLIGTGNPATVAINSSNQLVTLTNTYAQLLGDLTLSKVVTGATGGVDPGAGVTTFAVAVTCRDASDDPHTGHTIGGTTVSSTDPFVVDLTAGGAGVPIDGVPQGGDCTFTETGTAGLYPAYEWGTPTWTVGGSPAGSGDTITVDVGSGPVAVTLANPVVDNRGGFTVAKVVSPTDADPGSAFSVDYTCVLTGHPDSPWTGTVSVTTAATVAVTDIADGATCTVEEVDPVPGPASPFDWTGVSYSPDSIAVDAGTAPELTVITVTNTATRRTGSFQVVKQLDGATSGVVDGASFLVDYSCTLPAGGTPVTGQLAITVASPGVGPDLDAGTTCTLTEVTPSDDRLVGPSWAWDRWFFTDASGADVDPGQPVTLTVGDDPQNPVSVTVTNVVGRVRGPLAVAKSTSGATDGIVDPDTMFGGTWSCVFDAGGTNEELRSGTWSLPAGQVGEVADDLLVGSQCSITEDDADDDVLRDSSYRWLDPVISPATVTVTTGTPLPATITVDNPVAQLFGTFEVAKTVSGFTDGLVDGSEFTIEWTCVDPVDDSIVVDGTITIEDGETASPSASIPIGWTCTLTEDTDNLPTPATDDVFTWSWVVDAITTDVNGTSGGVTVEITVPDPTAGDGAITVTYDNPLDKVGGIQVTPTPSPAPTATPTPTDPKLPRTGSNVGEPIVVAMLLIAIGVALTVAGARRRRSAD